MIVFQYEIFGVALLSFFALLEHADFPFCCFVEGFHTAELANPLRDHGDVQTLSRF